MKVAGSRRADSTGSLGCVLAMSRSTDGRPMVGSRQTCYPSRRTFTHACGQRTEGCQLRKRDSVVVAMAAVDPYGWPHADQGAHAVPF